MPLHRVLIKIKNKNCIVNKEAEKNSRLIEFHFEFLDFAYWFKY